MSSTSGIASPATTEATAAARRARGRAAIEFGAGLLVLAGLAGMLALALFGSGRRTETGYRLSASFSHVDGLSVGGDVRLAGVGIGRVVSERVDPRTFQPGTAAEQVHLQRHRRDVRAAEGRTPGCCPGRPDDAIRAAAMSEAPPPLWMLSDGTPVACREKLVVLAENQVELEAVLRDAFEDAVLMGVDETWMRRHLHGVVDALSSPRRQADPA